MPIIRSAKKKLRQDKKRSYVNSYVEKQMKEAIQKARRAKDKKGLAKIVATAFSKIDVAVKKKIIHKSKANRLKSRISRILKK